ncbi:hypothetical protein, partial [Salmonella enterica]|uniref:hypothetical protein n=1 Tax=Salmonella enterica TaxID=28901 RepID=UPI00210D63CB
EPPTQGWKTQKSPITRRVFLCLSFGCTSVFSPSFEGFFFHFLLQPIPLIALANRTMPLPALS